MVSGSVPFEEKWWMVTVEIFSENNRVSDRERAGESRRYLI